MRPKREEDPNVWAEAKVRNTLGQVPGLYAGLCSGIASLNEPRAPTQLRYGDGEALRRMMRRKAALEVAMRRIGRNLP